MTPTRSRGWRPSATHCGRASAPPAFLTDDEKREAVGYQPGGGFARKDGFNPNQPRVPAGSEEGGRWADGGGVSGSIVRVQSRTRGPRGSGGPRPVMGRWIEATPEQETRLEIGHAQMQAAISRVQQLDRNWKPTPSLYETIEGEIAANAAATREAQDRLSELQLFWHRSWSLRGAIPAGTHSGETLDSGGDQ